ncbi:MAG: hypothetical protein WBB86_04400 [Candidatus Omnitrophota bacterium]|jgi:hypothetical protein
MDEHGKKEPWHQWKQAMQDESMPAEERIKLLGEMKEHLLQKIERADAVLAELKK